MFRTIKCSSSGRIVHAVLWYFIMHPYKQSGRCQDAFDNKQVSLACCYPRTHWKRTVSRTLATGNLFQKFPTFYGCGPFIVAITKVRQWSPSTARLSPFHPLYPTYLGFILILSSTLPLGFSSGISYVISIDTGQRARRSKVRILAEQRDISVPRKTRNRSWVHPTSCAVRTGALSRALSGRSLMLTTHRHLAPKLRRSGAVLLIPPYTFPTWTRKTLT